MTSVAKTLNFFFPVCPFILWFSQQQNLHFLVANNIVIMQRLRGGYKALDVIMH